MQFTFIEPQDPRWQSFLDRAEHDVYHEPGYVRLLGQERSMRPVACYGESGHSEMLIPLLLDPLPSELGLPDGLQDAQSPDGYPAPLFVGNAAAVAESVHDVMSFFRNEGLVTVFLRMHPLLGLTPDSFRETGEIVRRGPTVPIFLDKSYEQIRRNMRRDHRHDLRVGETRGYRVVFDDWGFLPDFVRLYRRLMDRVDAAEVYRFSDRYFREFRDAVPDSAHLAFVLDREGVPAAGTVFTSSSSVVQYHLAVSDATFRKDAPQKLLIDGLVRWGLRNGARVVHLGGGVGARTDSLFEFKAGFSRSRAIYSTVHLIPDREAASRASRRWAEMHGRPSDDGFFPIHRSPAQTD